MGAAIVATTLSALALEPGADGARAHARMPPSELAAAVRSYEIPAGSVATALNRLADASGAQIVYDARLTRAMRTAGISGRHRLDEALGRLLSGTGLDYELAANGRTVSILLAQADTEAWTDAGFEPLPPIDIAAAERAVDGKTAYGAERGAITEGSGTYTTPLVTVAGKVPLPRKEIPQSVTVVTREQMNDQNLHTMQDVMFQTPGVSAISNDAGQSQPASRGYALDLMNDGVPSYGAFAGYQQYDMALYDRIEVLKGPSGLLMGSGSPGGVVNVVKKRPKDEFKLKGDFTAGSWDNYRGMVDVTGPINEDRSLRYRAVLLHSDKRFFYDRAQEWKWLGYGALEYDITPNTLANFSYSRQYYNGPSYAGLPVYAFPTLGGTSNIFLNVPRSANPYPSWNEYQWDTQELTARIEHRFGDDWVAKLVWNRRDQNFEFFDAYPTTGVNPASGALSYARRHHIYYYHRTGLDSYVSGSVPLFGRLHRVTFGYNYDRYSYENKGRNYTGVTGVPFYAPDLVAQPFDPFDRGGQNQTLQHGAYGQLRLNPIDPLTFVLGARLTNFFAKTRQAEPSAPGPWVDGAKSNRRFTPYLAGIFRLTDEINLYGSYSDIFVPQTLLKTGGGTLDPRVGGQYEAGVKGEFFDKRFNASAAWFDIRDKNRGFADPANPGYYLQAGEVESTGVETEFSGKPLADLAPLGLSLPGLDIVGGYTYLKTKYLADRNNPGRSFNSWYPTHMFKIWGKYDFDGDLQGLTVGAGVVAQSSLTGSINSWNETRRQPPYAVVNAMLSYKFNQNVALQFNINNIFDEKFYTRVGGQNTYNTPGEPRNFMVTLRGEY